MNRRETAIEIQRVLENREVSSAMLLRYYRGTTFSLHCLDTWINHDIDVEDTLEEIRSKKD